MNALKTLKTLKAHKWTVAALLLLSLIAPIALVQAQLQEGQRIYNGLNIFPDNFIKLRDNTTPSKTLTWQLSGIDASTDQVINVGPGTIYQGLAPQFNLTDNTIATFAVQTLGNDTGAGGSLNYCVYASNATTAGLECGEIDYGGIDVTAGAGGEVCTTPVKQAAAFQALSGSLLTVTFAASTGTDLCNLRVTADTDIATPVELWIKYWPSPANRVLTPQ